MLVTTEPLSGASSGYAPRQVDRKSDCVLSCRTTGLMYDQQRRPRPGIHELPWSLNGKRRTDASALSPYRDHNEGRRRDRTLVEIEAGEKTGRIHGTFQARGSQFRLSNLATHGDQVLDIRQRDAGYFDLHSTNRRRLYNPAPKPEQPKALHPHLVPDCRSSSGTAA